MPVALRTKKRHRAYALKIFNAAKRAKLIVANPVEDVEGYRGRKNDDGQIHVLTPEQVTSLLSAVDAEIRPLAVRAAATLRFTSSIPLFTI
jgi:site-specific recombinase XerD